MKSGTMDLPKFKRLMKRLKIGRMMAAGLLVSLWDFAMKDAPEGDIGRNNDAEDIAAMIDWDGDASDLVEGLVETRWLDRVDDERKILIHDWVDHIPNFLKASLAAKKAKNDRKIAIKEVPQVVEEPPQLSEEHPQVDQNAENGGAGASSVPKMGGQERTSSLVNSIQVQPNQTKSCQISDSAVEDSESDQMIGHPRYTPQFETFVEIFPEAKRGSMYWCFNHLWHDALEKIQGCRRLKTTDDAVVWLTRKARKYAESDQGKSSFSKGIKAFLSEEIYNDSETTWVSAKKQESRDGNSEMIARMAEKMKAKS